MADASSRTARARGHEVADVAGRRIAWGAVGLVVSLGVVALTAFSAHGLLRPDRTTGESHAQAPTQPIAQPAIPSTPQLQAEPTLDLKTLRQQKGAMLDRYRWIDRGKGVVQVPIERAMQLAVERSATTHPDDKKQAEAPQ
ncbi:MAG: hypothetical protein ACR2GP_01425 [Burkholderiaceae bacterium]